MNINCFIVLLSTMISLSIGKLDLINNRFAAKITLNDAIGMIVTFLWIMLIVICMIYCIHWILQKYKRNKIIINNSYEERTDSEEIEFLP